MFAGFKNKPPKAKVKEEKVVDFNKILESADTETFLAQERAKERPRVHFNIPLDDSLNGELEDDQAEVSHDGYAPSVDEDDSRSPFDKLKATVASESTAVKKYEFKSSEELASLIRPLSLRHQQQPAAAAAGAANFGRTTGFGSRAAVVSPPPMQQQLQPQLPVDDMLDSPCDDSDEWTEVDEEEEEERERERGPTKYPDEAMPWGKRPRFGDMVEGGKVKLTLVDPGADYQTYFAPRADSGMYRPLVNNSLGCTFDELSAVFYATDAGERGGRRYEANGGVVALDGHCKRAPACIATGLRNPAAISVYKPSESVVVVTDDGHFVLTRQDKTGQMMYDKRQISRMYGFRGVAVTGSGGVISFHVGSRSLMMVDGMVQDGGMRILSQVDYQAAIRSAMPHKKLFRNPSCCFMDAYGSRLAVSDLGWRVLSVWEIGEDNSLRLLHTADVDCAGQRSTLGKCAYPSGIRLGADCWVLCVDADRRTVQIFDDTLRFVSRVETPKDLPYISGMYIEGGCHMMVCDRHNKCGGLRVYKLDTVEATDDAPDGRQTPPSPAAVAAKTGFAAAAAAPRYTAPAASQGSSSYSKSAAHAAAPPPAAKSAFNGFESSHSRPAENSGFASFGGGSSRPAAAAANSPTVAKSGFNDFDSSSFRSARSYGSSSVGSINTVNTASSGGFNGFSNGSAAAAAPPPAAQSGFTGFGGGASRPDAAAAAPTRAFNGLAARQLQQMNKHMQQ